MRLIVVWILNAVALLAIPHIIPGIVVGGFSSALISVAILAFINTLIRPLIILLTLPVTILTLGFFIFVINGLLFWLAGSMLPGFQVNGFLNAVLGAILYSVISWILHALLLPPKTTETSKS
jgi:putative membrane protein